MNHFRPPHINKKTYAWSVRAFSTVKRILGVNIQLHAEDNQIASGDIFLFNHFSRFETFIPQYLIYLENQSYCRSVAAHNFFEGDPRFTQYLYQVGAIPNDMPDLFALLAKDILRGLKIIIFPEGGMIKDRKVLSDTGEYEIYSPSSQKKRKHHSGAARLAYVLDLVKQQILKAYEGDDQATLAHWQRELDISDLSLLIKRCEKPTTLVPSNITFFPIRISENFLKTSVERFTGPLSAKYREELLIEGNLVFKDTDMDIRMGPLIEIKSHAKGWQNRALRSHMDNARTLSTFFAFNNKHLDHSIQAARDQVMAQMYGLVTVNLSHLASLVIMKLMEQEKNSIPLKDFYRLLYLSARYVNHGVDCHLHHSLLSAQTYMNLALGTSKMMHQFFRSTQRANLLKCEAEQIVFLDKLREESAFHDVRMENPICVYANECAPIKGVTQALDRAFANFETFTGENWAQLYFEDEVFSFDHDRHLFQGAKYQDVHDLETAYRSGAPYFHSAQNKQGVLLIHGFLASPAELNDLGQKISDLGYPVMGVRLSGHGTSPYDLMEKSWRDWARSVRHGYEVLAQTCSDITIVGFSTGGALALHLAAQNPDKLDRVCAVNTPLYFANPNLRFVPIIHHANRLARWLAAQEGVLPFILNKSEHPDINYHHIPVRALYELRKLIDKMEKILDQVTCPVHLIQGSHDHVVQPKSAKSLREKMTGTSASLQMIESHRHGIITEDIQGTVRHILNFIDENRL